MSGCIDSGTGIPAVEVKEGGLVFQGQPELDNRALS